MSDPDLLHAYARDGSQAAFAALVSRHVNLVYSAARRQVRSPQLAEEIAQSVFLDLARRAAALPVDQPLAAWLHVVTRRTAIDTIRRESRRLAREQAAASDPSAMPISSTPWPQLEPLLDEAVAALPDTDRHAILLRFFENKSHREIGAALGTSDDAAQKRVSRALDQLRDFFARRGAAVTAAALAADLSAHAILTAPATLGGSITASVLATVSTVTVPVAAMTLAQKALGGAVAAALIGVIAYNAISRPTPTPGAPAVSQAPTNEVSAAPAAPSRPAPATAPVIPGSPVDLRIALLRQLLAELPAQRLPELKLLSSEDWLAIARAHELDTAADIRVALAELRAVARKKFAAPLQDALRLYTSGSGGELPTDIAHLAPHLVAPADAEMLARYELTRTGKLGEPAERLLREKPTSDIVLSVGLDGWDMKNNAEHAPAFGESDFDALERAAKSIGNALGPDGEKLMAAVVGGTSALKAMIDDVAKSMEQVYTSYGGEEAFGAELKKAVRQFAAAHPGESVTDLGQILPFFPGVEKLVALARPSLAPMAYLAAHPGQPPPDAEQLRRYLDRSPDLTAAFKAMKLAWDGEHLTMSFDFKWGGKKD